MDKNTNAEKKLKCIFIGPLANHAVIGRVAAFSACGYQCYLINSSSVDTDWLDKMYPISGVQIIDNWLDPYYRINSNIRTSIKELLRILSLIKENSSIENSLKLNIEKYKPDFAIVHYGSYAIHSARIIKRIAPWLPIIDIVNLIPSYVNDYKGFNKIAKGWRGRLEDLNYFLWIRKIEGIICATKEMEDFIIKKYEVQREKMIVLPDFLPLSFHGKTSIVKSPKKKISDPRIIFLGAPERFGTVIDSVDSHFRELVKIKIHIYSGSISEDIISTGYGHKYPVLKNEEVFRGELATYASQFDAAIIVYNVSKRHERFRTTLPTRLFSAITAGIPVAVKSGYFDSCERFVKEHDIGFVYESARELRNILLDEKMMDRYRNNIALTKSFMTAENQSELLMKYVQKIINPNLN